MEVRKQIKKGDDECTIAIAGTFCIGEVEDQKWMSRNLGSRNTYLKNNQQLGQPGGSGG